MKGCHGVGSIFTRNLKNYNNLISNCTIPLNIKVIKLYSILNVPAVCLCICTYVKCSTHGVACVCMCLCTHTRIYENPKLGIWGVFFQVKIHPLKHISSPSCPPTILLLIFSCFCVTK